MSNINVIKGGICAVEGVRAAGTREGKYGLTVIESKDSNASAVFTSICISRHFLSTSATDKLTSLA